jgi:hypothetical protein
LYDILPDNTLEARVIRHLTLSSSFHPGWRTALVGATTESCCFPPVSNIYGDYPSVSATHPLTSVGHPLALVDESLKLMAHPFDSMAHPLSQWIIH